LSKAEHSIAGLASIWQACPKWHAERLPWQVAFTAVQLFFISFAWLASLCCEEYMYIYAYLIAWRVYMNCHCYQVMLEWNIFTQIRSSVECWLDIYHGIIWPGGNCANTWHYLKCFRIFFLNRK
jgi:hypothetical protein